MPLQSKGILPPPLSELYREDYLALPYPELLTKCEETFEALSVSSEQVKAVEEKTREQSNSKTWFHQRAARITVSQVQSSSKN